MTSINYATVKQVSSYSPDTTVPMATKFTVDLSAGTFNISFSKPMKVNSFTLNGMYVQDRVNTFKGGIIVALTQTGSSLVAYNYELTRFTFKFGRTNLNAIQVQVSESGALCQTAANCFLWADTATTVVARDTIGNPVTAINFDKLYALQASDFKFDTSNPYLEKWYFDYG